MQKYPNDSFYSTIQISKALQVSRITVFRYIKEGKLKAVKEGRSYGIAKSAYHEFKFECVFTDEQRATVLNIIREMVLPVA
jgi:excisionase family DNA binding protein